MTNWLAKAWAEESATANYATAADLEACRRKIFSLESRILALENQYKADQIHPQRWYHRDEMGADLPASVASTAAALPWVSRLTQFREQLTSPAFVMATLGESALIGVCGLIVGGGAALVFELPWSVSPAAGAGAFALTAAALIVHNRALLHHTVTAQADRGKRRAELVVEVHGDRGEGDEDRQAYIRRLLIKCDVKPGQLGEWARSVLDGRSLAINGWTGAGALFSRGQYEAWLSELVVMGYVANLRGTQGHVLTPPGRALCRELSKV